MSLENPREDLKTDTDDVQTTTNTALWVINHSYDDHHGGDIARSNSSSGSATTGPATTTANSTGASSVEKMKKSNIANNTASRISPATKQEMKERISLSSQSSPVISHSQSCPSGLVQQAVASRKSSVLQSFLVKENGNGDEPKANDDIQDMNNDAELSALFQSSPRQMRGQGKQFKNYVGISLLFSVSRCSFFHFHLFNYIATALNKIDEGGWPEKQKKIVMH